jgi:folate-dependent phosphoribosylglycinamide formyltransferase PurN
MRLVLLTNPSDEFSNHFLRGIDPPTLKRLDIWILILDRKHHQMGFKKKLRYFWKFIGIKRFINSILKPMINRDNTIEGIAQNLDLPIEKISMENLAERLKEIRPDVGVVASLGHILPNEILDIPDQGFINIHPSFLPYHRGPHPIFWALYDMDEETGVTILRMGERIDVGEILIQEKIKILLIDEQQICYNLGRLGGKLFSKIISHLHEIEPVMVEQQRPYEKRPSLKRRKELNRRLEKGV